jgi:DNA-binding HxlR family transcriptional regulator
MLSQQLHSMEADGLIHKKVYPVVPPKTEYSLTGKGKPLKTAIYAICDWGRTYMAGTFYIFTKKDRSRIVIVICLF